MADASRRSLYPVRPRRIEFLEFPVPHEGNLLQATVVFLFAAVLTVPLAKRLQLGAVGTIMKLRRSQGAAEGCDLLIFND